MINEHTSFYLANLAGLDTVYDFRGIHDRNPDAPGRVVRGTIAQVNDMLQSWQADGYAPHVMLNETDGAGRLIQNVTRCRVQLCDLDGPSAPVNHARLQSWKPAAQIVVNTSPGKYHWYWLTTAHTDKQLFTDNQRRLIAEFAGDRQFVDCAHTARLPGFYHLKSTPHFVTAAAGPGYGHDRYDPWEIARPLMHHVVTSANSERKPLGTPSMAAPSWEWLVYALQRIDPNALGFMEWIAITAAIKQAGWHFGEPAVRGLWEWWCSGYHRNNPGENAKQWNHISETQSGWNALAKSANIQAEYMAAQAAVAVPSAAGATVTNDEPQFEEFLTPAEQQLYFRNCFWVNKLGRILTPPGYLADSTTFNGMYGGKQFIIDNVGTKTDEPWKAATRGRAYRTPKVDHLRFLPELDFGAIVKDEFGRDGVNTYQRPRVALTPGDVGPFLRHLANVLPDARDQAIVLSYLAHNVQRPGSKVPWAIVIQSMEGAGKTIFKEIMSYALGTTYIHGPNAKELTESGGKFTGWLANKLMIIVDEIRVDEKRDLIEVLKPLISDLRVEVQRKRVDQEMADNPANWLMFTNYKDAVPINKNSRRYSIFYSAIQTVADLQIRGMDGRYFNALFKWVRTGGAAHVAHYLMHYPIPAEFDPLQDATRAPVTSSTPEVIEQSKSLIETLISEAVSSDLPGFRNGWVSTIALANLMREQGLNRAGPRTVSSALTNLGYKLIGKAPKAYAQEFSKIQPRLYNLSEAVNLHNYGNDQGYNFM